MQRACDICGEPYEAKRQSSRFCSDRCRKRHHRGAKPQVVKLPTRQVEAQDAPDDHTVELATKGALESAGRLDTPIGRIALALARRLDERQGTDQGAASVSKELRAVMAEALRDVKQAADPLDELRALRDRKRHAG